MVQDVLLGGIAGLCGTFVGHPLDTIRVSYFISYRKGSNGI